MIISVAILVFLTLDPLFDLSAILVLENVFTGKNLSHNCLFTTQQERSHLVQRNVLT